MAIEGTGDSTIGIHSAPPGPPDTYLGVANSMIRGVEQLAAANPCCHLAHALVACHVLECALKACLSCDGDDSHLKTPGRCDTTLWGYGIKRITRAWKSRVTPFPDWVQTLSHIHNNPYYLRYSTGINGLMTPGPEPSTTELRALLTKVNEFVRTHRR